MKLENVPTIRDLLDVAPAKHNDRTFIKYLRDGEIVEKKFSEVRSDGLAVCRKLRHDIAERNHIAIISKSTYEYIACMTGVLCSGNVAIPVDPDSTVSDTAAIINDSDATAVLYGAEFADKINEVKALCPKLQYEMVISEENFSKIYEEFSETSEYAALSDYKMEPEKCALIIYTSGTTGDKKGVMLSSEALVSNLIFEPYDPITVRVDTVLSVLPLHHIFCFICGYIGPLNIGTCVCLNGEMKELFKNLLVFKPDQIRVVPMIAQAILARIRAIQAKNPALSPKEAAAQVTGGNLDMMLSGGAYLDPALCKAYEPYGIFLRQGYGMSEASAKVTLPDPACPVDSVGRLMSTVNARIADDGEIQLDTPGMMLGYYKRPEETAEVITEDGWLRTGDIGRIDENRVLYIKGRLKNLIILSNGENVSPEGIENRYLTNRLVGEVVVYAENDLIVAEIFPNEEFAQQNGITDIKAALEELTDKLNETALPSHIVAKLIVRDTPLEKTELGKIKRRQHVVGKE